jgi:hypothetical protein
MVCQSSLAGILYKVMSLHAYWLLNMVDKYMYCSITLKAIYGFQSKVVNLSLPQYKVDTYYHTVGDHMSENLK